MNRLTHVDETGAARMVDVSAKAVTAREATAAGRVLVGPGVVALLRGTGVPKGDAVAVARIAGIAGAKRTPDLVPLCHPIALHGVTVDLEVTDDAVEITATARTADRTGVEMEALTAVTVAGLTMIDMVKAVDPRASITDVRLLRKSGGKSGSGPDDARGRPRARGDRLQPRRGRRLRGPQRAGPRRGPGRAGLPGGGPQGAARRRRSARGRAPRRRRRRDRGRAHHRRHRALPTDVTPEATRRVLEREAPGIAEAVRRYGAENGVPTAVLSRGLAGVAGRTLIVNLPGSTGGVKDGLAVLGPLLPHVVSQLRGGDH